MTEYGRGAGHEPWHPEDPLYGDQGWPGQQAAQGQQGPYGGQPQQYQQEPQQPYYEGQQQHQQHPGYPEQQQPYNEQQYGNNGGWDTGHQQQEPVPYGMNPAPDPYAGQQPAYSAADSPDYYAAPDAYPPPQPPNQRRAPEPEPAPEWAPEHEAPEEHPFFTGADDAPDDEPRESRRGRGSDRRGGKPKKKKSRNGTACLFVTVVLVGGVGGIGYFGYQFYQDQFGAPEDFTGSGTGSVEVEIPKGAGLGQMGNILAKEGVVKSSEAFVSAATANRKAQGIQPGVYPMKKEMSAKAAVDLMINPSNLNAIIVGEGWRNAKIYEEIDKKLRVDVGTTQEVAKEEYKELGLPEWANDNSDIKDPLEGFLYPSRYEIGGKSTPKTVLKEMVARAKGNYASAKVEAESKRLGLESPLQLITVASLVQAEGKTHDDFRKMSEVIYNRLKPTNTETNQLLQFDSALNYLKGQSEIEISEAEANSNMDPYNTYRQRGLTPGPIGNPGTEAMAAALNPTAEGWLYFVATDGRHETEFAKTYPEFKKLRDKFNASQGID
ncbi:endolytic transglycosylase MltG [Streptomyces sp. ISL-96]|uniref:endolytic transglycosylase MltG n=1 Tax=Streptomyces sp. ISL-96 TaxID=2819191 RepID=UPI001BE90D25|nr:endolytic transglycosylase MltG [Streptomyces sp. ISL-96]MBT2493630.1 endolytic transglycosylase MltG [Streptomyces sp. ISL-96]